MSIPFSMSFILRLMGILYLDPTLSCCFCYLEPSTTALMKVCKSTSKQEIDPRQYLRTRKPRNSSKSALASTHIYNSGCCWGRLSLKLKNFEACFIGKWQTWNFISQAFSWLFQSFSFARELDFNCTEMTSIKMFAKLQQTCFLVGSLAKNASFQLTFFLSRTLLCAFHVGMEHQTYN